MAKEEIKSKGGRKGGAAYPKLALEKAVKYAKKLVAKTHTGAQPKNIILPGVFESGSWVGEVKLSGTKQFGFVIGDSKGFSASDLAKKINSATPEELPALLAESVLKPKIFKTLHDTFVNDTITNAKIKQQILQQNVHPESADECVDIFKKSMIYAGLATAVENDKIQIFSISKQHNVTPNDNDEVELSEEEKDDLTEEKSNLQDTNVDNQSKFDESKSSSRKSSNTNIQVNIDVDPSMDPEKLEKLLKLLKSYGAI